jgi:hypothetical protein
VLALGIVTFVKSFGVLVTIIALAMDYRPFFSGSPAEALILILIELEYVDQLSFLANTVVVFVVLMALLSFLVCTYTALGFLIFDPNQQESLQYFPTFGTGVWNMLMVLNGSDWPTPMMPAFDYNRLYVIYFYFYLICMDWGLLNLVTGFIYGTYRIERKRIDGQLKVGY